MKVEFIDLKARYLSEKKDIIKCIDKVLKKGNLVLTEELNEFENEICKFTGSKYCLGLNSGTDALMMSLWACGVGKGDEVITSSKSFIATIGSIVHVGAKPILVDVGDDLNINADLIEKHITSKTKAIIPVHWTGRICNMKVINRISKKYNLKLIEDAAQAMGSTYYNKKAGTFGDIAAFSCHPLKNLNALGDAGFIITNKKKLYDKIKLYRNHGLYKRDDARIFGVNSRLDSLNATVLSYRLSKLDEVIKKRRKNIAIYRKRLSMVEGILLPQDKEYEYSSYVMFVVQCRKRDQLQKYLLKEGIQTIVYYGNPLHKHLSSKKMKLDTGNLKNSEKICKKVLALPHHQHLSEKQINFVCKKIMNFYKNN